MCIFRYKHNGLYMCGKRYPLECRPDVCPFGDLWQVLVRRDERVKMYWIMPGQHLVSLADAVAALQSGEAQYIVKSISMYVGRGRHGKKPHSRRA
ncbi:MAG: hypothetical protein QXI60_01010 [Thermofilaceae archaeon]